MELLERYLEAVRKLLPWKRQDDIIAELRANLESQLEDEETKQGRPLTAEEAAAWLKGLGAPTQMASLYQPQQYLIGPRFFSIYWAVMRTALFWYSVVYVVIGIVQCAVQDDPLRALLGTAAQLPISLLIMAGCVTLVFAVMEVLVTRFPERFTKAKREWSPASLPPVPPMPLASPKPQARMKAVGGLIFSLVGLIFWLVVLRHPYIIMGSAAQYLHLVPFQAAPVCWQFYWWVVALTLVNIAWRIAQLALGSWQRSRAVREFACLALALIPQSIMLFAPGHTYFELRDSEQWMRYEAAMGPMNHAIYVFFAVIFAVTILQLLFRARRLVSEYRKQLAQA
jgi:hypothetical protein